MNIRPKIVDCSSGFTDENDIFNRKEIGNRISSIIKKCDQNLVIALESGWGEGKTTFIKMWQSENKDEFEIIYFDSYENDYQKDPFISLSSEIYSHLNPYKYNSSHQRWQTKVCFIPSRETNNLMKC